MNGGSSSVLQQKLKTTPEQVNNINKGARGSYTYIAYPDVLTNSNEEGLARVRGEHMTAKFTYDSLNTLSINHPEIHRRHINTDKYAFILPDTIAAYITTRRPCDLQRVGKGFLMNRGYGLAVPKGSALLSYLNRALISLEADGTLHKLYTKWWSAGSQCDVPLPPGSKHSGRMFRSSDFSNSAAGTIHTCYILNMSRSFIFHHDILFDMHYIVSLLYVLRIFHCYR